MSNRSISVTLRANVADFNRQIKASSKSLEELAKAGDKTGTVADTAMGRITQSAQLQSDAWATASNAFLAYGAVVGAGVGFAIKQFADFDEGMSAVQAATHASAADMGLLRGAAIQAGADTAYSASEAAGAIEELAKAGVSTTDILGGGLNGALSLAAAGGLDVAEAAGIASIALTQFKLDGSDVGHVADLLAAGAGKAMGDVRDLGFALKQSGLIASQTGLSIEETTGALAAFASAGLLGSDAGTSFKTMLQRLNPQSKAAQTLMDDLGLSAYDAQGNFVGLAEYAGRLQNALKDMTTEERRDAMNKLFGLDSVRAAGILFEQGAEGIQAWIDKVNDAGYAADTADKRMDNLKGDIEKLSGSLETAFIRAGSGANDMLRDLVQWLDKIVDGYSKLPPETQQAVLKVVAFTAAASAAAGISMKLFQGVIEVASAFRSLNSAFGVTEAVKRNFHNFVSGLSAVRSGTGEAIGAVRGFGDAWVIARTSGVSNIQAIGQAATPVFSGVATAAKGAGSALLGAFGGPVGAAITASIVGITWALGSYSRAQAEAQSLAEQYAGTLDEMTGAVTKNTRALVAEKLQTSGAISAYRALGGDAKDLVDAVMGVGDAQARVNALMEETRQRLSENGDALDQTGLSMTELSQHIGTVEEQVGKQSTALEASQTRHEEITEALGDSADAQGEFGGAVDDATDAIASQQEQLDGLIESLSTAAGIVLSAREAWRQFENAIDKANETIIENGANLDITTEAGRQNQAALDDIAKSGWKVIESLNAQGASEEELQQAMAQTRAAFLEAADAAGMEEQAAHALADSLELIPSNVKTIIELPGAAQAKQQADNMKTAVNAIPGAKNVEVSTSGTDSAIAKINSVSAALRSIGSYHHVAAGLGGSGGITMATGGPVIGPGTGTSDSIPAMLSNGEHVLTAREVQAAGGHGAIYRLRQALTAGGVPAFAAGGHVGHIPTSHYTPSPIPQAALPDRITLQAEDGTYLGVFRTVARQESIRTVSRAGR